ncbi:hypothetical protein GQR58_021573 [Nymphon striatum]|nr:hypothetical protein GQR58_021573 [Nymphon striatum]
MYKRTTKSSAVNELRYEMIASKCGGQTGLEIKLERKVDLSSLPPPRSCLNEHIRRVNYQVGIWKRAHIPKPIIPEATDDHGWVKRNCQIEPKWSAGDVIPPKLADVLEKMECDDDDEGQDDSETDSDDSEYEEAIPSSDTTPEIGDLLTSALKVFSELEKIQLYFYKRIFNLLKFTSANHDPPNNNRDLAIYSSVGILIWEYFKLRTLVKNKGEKCYKAGLHSHDGFDQSNTNIWCSPIGQSGLNLYSSSTNFNFRIKHKQVTNRAQTQDKPKTNRAQT